jgi:5-dehydro-2-deoxygluconokinase
MYFIPLDRQAPWPAGALAATKRAIYDGLLDAAATAHVPTYEMGMIVDESSGAPLMHDGQTRGVVMACAIRPRDDAAFDGDALAATHLRSCTATYWHVVMRYNPDGDRAANLRQASGLRRLSGGLRRRMTPRLMCDLVVPPTERQLAAGIRGYERDLLPELTTRAMTELLDAGVEPDVWVIEGLQQQDAYARVIDVATGGGRRATCLIRAAGHTDATTRALMMLGLKVPGVSGVVLSGAAFWAPAAAWMCGRSSRAAAVAGVAAEFQKWVNQFEAAV